MEIIFKILTSIANVFAILASCIAIYLFIFKRAAISSAVRVLLNYSAQITLSDFKAKLERLNELSADDQDESKNVINILNEILGQIRGSKLLLKHFDEVFNEISALASGKGSLTEPKKRALVSELRERLRNINVESYTELMGE